MLKNRRKKEWCNDEGGGVSKGNKRIIRAGGKRTRQRMLD